MCSVSVVTVVFIHTMEDDQRLNTLVHEGDTVHLSEKQEIAINKKHSKRQKCLNQASKVTRQQRAYHDQICLLWHQIATHG